MGLIGNAAKKAGKAAANKASSAAKTSALRAVPGMCPVNGKRHRYKNQNAGNDKSDVVVLGCDCGVMCK